MEWMEQLEFYFNAGITLTIHLLELMGVIIIIIGAVRDFFCFFAGRGSNIRLDLAQSMALGLEFKLGGEILRTVEIFRCKVVDVSTNEMTIEATGDHGKLEAIISLLQRFGIKELARTGSVAMRRSKKVD